MSITLALHDAANNCTRLNAQCEITLRSGVQVSGKLGGNPANLDTWVLHQSGGGWTTFLVEEVAAVSSSH